MVIADFWTSGYLKAGLMLLYSLGLLIAGVRILRNRRKLWLKGVSDSPL